MANITYRKDKAGRIVSAQFRVYRGRDKNKKPLKPYCTTWRVPDSMRNPRTIRKTAAQKAAEFEQECKKGEIALNKGQTFEEYSAHFIEVKTKSCKHSTVERYKDLLRRINAEIGYLKMDRITGEHINDLYDVLRGEETAREIAGACCKPALAEALAASKKTRAALAEETGLSINTVYSAIKGKKVSTATARSIAEALGRPLAQVFDDDGIASNLSENTIHHYHSLLHALFALAVKEGVAGYNPADKAIAPSVQEHEAEFLEMDQVGDLMDALQDEPSEWKALLYVLIATGARRGEAMGLKWSAVDFEHNIIEIRENLLYSKARGVYVDSPKGKKSRYVTVDPEVTALLKKLKHDQGVMRVRLGLGIAKDDYCFTSPVKLPEPSADLKEEPPELIPLHPDSLNTWLRGFTDRHDLPHIHPHELRHTQASILYEEGENPVTISKRLGHAKVSTTQDIYAHLVAKADAKASEKIAGVMFKHKTA